MSLVFIAFFALIVLPALDYRYAWSPVAPWVSILGNVLIVLSFVFIFWVIRVNSFAASNIRVEQDQKVIDTGPVRARPSSDGTRAPFGSSSRNPARARFVVVAFGLIVPFMPVLLWRLLDEERVLQRDLPGYADYMRKSALSSDSVPV